MCGCGTFFCRKCSPSRAFCPSCYEKSQAIARQAVARQPVSSGQPRVALAHAGGGHTVHLPVRPISRRLLIEATTTLILAVMILVTMFAVQQRSIAYSPDPLVSYGINAGREPAQEAVYPFDITYRHNGVRATLSGDATYVINARVQSTRAYDDEISDIIPYDFLLSWGDLADEDVSSKLNWEQADRRGQVSGTLGGTGGAGVSSDYVITHVSNNHLIPANDGIRSELNRVQPGDMVRIEGRLVNVKVFAGDNRVLSIMTSKSRTDQGDGACEVIFVEGLRVNGETF